jgi:peptide/nickel transport system permease protein
MVLITVVAAVFAPAIAPYGETEIVGDVWLSSSKDHLLGTDHLGRDLFTRLLYGARNTIALAFVTTMLSFLIGIICGFFAATLGGWTDLTLSRMIDILMAFPTLIFALMVLSVVGTSVTALILVIAALDSTRVYRLSRAGPGSVVKESGGSCATKFFPMPCRLWLRNLACASVLCFCSLLL